MKYFMNVAGLVMEENAHVCSEKSKVKVKKTFFLY